MGGVLSAPKNKKTRTKPTKTPFAGLERSLEKAGIATFLPHDGAEFQELASPYNLRLAPTPHVVVLPKTENDIVHIIKSAKRANLKITVRSGGHSYAAHSLGGHEKSVLVIDMKNFQSLVYNEADHTVTAGAGFKLGDFALGISKYGRAMPHGTCPTVGLGGHATHGGYGFYSRLWGLAMDRIVSLRVVLADGKIVVASAKENSDLFFALKGAGPSFGIVTSFTLRTEPMPKKEENVRFLFTWDLTSEAASTAFLRWQEWLQNAPPELGMAFRLGASSSKGMLKLDFLGQFFGPLEKLFKELGPQLDQLGPRSTEDIAEHIEWLEMLEWLGEGPLESAQIPKMTDCFYAKSLTIREDAPMSLVQIQALTEHISQQTELDWFAMADNWGGKGSVINAQALESSALGSRSNLFGWQFYGRSPNRLPPFPEGGSQFVQGMWDAVVNAAPTGWTYGGFACYVDPNVPKEEVWKLYHGPHVTRLQTIKRKVDPKNVFSSFPHAFTA